MKNEDAPQAPNPETIIPLQGQENRKTFDYQLGQMRTNTSGPTGSTSWSKVPTFDEAGYNAALDKYNQQLAAAGGPGNAPTATSTPPPQYVVGSNDPNAINGTNPSSGGGSSGISINPNYAAVAGLGAAPNKNDFTTYDWTQNTTLSPEQQALYESNTRGQQGQSNLANTILGQAQSTLGQPIDLSGLPSRGGVDQYYSGLADRSLGDQFNNTVSDAAYKHATTYLDPQVAESRRALEARLADQGFTPGTPGYSQAMRDFEDSNNRQYESARTSAIGQGYAQGNTQLGQQTNIAQGLGNNQNQSLQQALQVLLTGRNQPLNELAALRSGTGVQMPSTSGTSQTPNISPTDIMGALNTNYQQQLGGYNAGVAGSNATIGAGSSLIAALIPYLATLSDIRVKEDIIDIGALPSGIRVVRFRYIGQPQVYVGVIAQDVQRIQPEAVVEGGDGLLRVYYGRLR